MSTTTPTAVSAAPAPVYAPAQPRRSNGWVAATIIAAVFALLGMFAAVFMAVAGPTTAHAANHSSSVVSHHKHSSPVSPVNPVTPVHPVTPKVTPSDSIKLEQQQLGQLNYYEGPINGYDTLATINAVKYLQRDAGLPQTGQMNTATQNALTKMLITGNNHMAG